MRACLDFLLQQLYTNEKMVLFERLFLFSPFFCLCEIHLLIDEFC